MRPAVYASVLRNRKSSRRRVQSAPHQYSWRRFFVMAFVGGILFIPGLVVTIIGIENADNIENIPGDRVLYKVIGPAGLACGVGLLLTAGIYYCCWGFQRPVRSRHSSKHRKKHKEEQLDPLHTKASAVPSISQPGNQPYSSVRSHGTSSPTQRGHSPSWSPDRKADRHYSNSHHSHHGSSKSPRATPETSSKGYHRSSRHRSPSAHHNSHHGNSHHDHHHSSPHQLKRSSHHDKPVSDNQVPLVETDAPLAQGESGSVDISIDMEVISDNEKKL